MELSTQLLSLGRRWYARFEAWRRARRTYAELAALDDRLLEDLGFRRVRLGADRATIVPVLDEKALRDSAGPANDNAAARRETSRPASNDSATAAA